MLWTGILIGAGLCGGLSSCFAGVGIIMIFAFVMLIGAVLCIFLFAGGKIIFILLKTLFGKCFSKNYKLLALSERHVIKVIVVVIALLSFMVLIRESDNRSAKVPKSDSASLVEMHEYDSLQKIFISLNANITEDDLKVMITKESLSHSQKVYSGNEKIYIIAYEKECTVERHAKPGDYLSISFDSKGKIKNGEYYKTGGLSTALYYNHGVWWKFADDVPSNKYTGWYIIRYGEKENGIKIRYSNGNSSKTNYYPCGSAEEALNGIL